MFPTRRPTQPLHLHVLRAARGRRSVSRAVIMLVLVLASYIALTSLTPEPWQEADLVHVVRVMSDVQQFPVQDMTEAARQRILAEVLGVRPNALERYSQSKLRINASGLWSPADLSLVPQSDGDFYPQFFAKLTALEAAANSNPLAARSAEALRSFRPILTSHEKWQLLRAYDAFAHACDAAGVTYFLSEASLMGVRRHHGMIPWDDDIDLVVNASQWRQLHALLSSIPGFELFAPGDVQWKFYTNASRAFPDKPFKFPYLDIFFFSEDDEYVWALTKGLKHDLAHPKGNIFPLRYREFEGRRVPVPRNLQLLVDGTHDAHECITGEYNHKTNQRFYYGGKVSMPCSALRDVYPFVDRVYAWGGTVVETLRVGDSVVHTLSFQEA